MKRSLVIGIGVASLLALPYAAYRTPADSDPLPMSPMREARAAETVKVESRSRLIQGREVGEVLMNGEPVFRIRSGAGGLTAPRRAEIVAERLAGMVNSGQLSADDVRMGTMNGQRVLTANGELLITADQYHANVNGTTPARLASMWQNNIVTALGGTVARNPNQKGRYGAATLEDVRPDLRTKLVPVLSVGTGLRLGMAQVTGPERDVDEVQAVAEVETEWRRVARARLYVPVSNVNVTRGINRVPRVGVSAMADVRLRF